MNVERVVLPALVRAARDDIGGVPTYVVELERRLRGRGVDVDVLGYGPTDDPSTGFSTILDGEAPRGRDLILALWKRRNTWTFPHDAVVHLQRPDEVLGFLKGPWPLVVSVHGCHKRTVSMRQGKLAGFVYGVVQRRMSERADALVFETHQDHDAYLAVHPEVRDKVHLLPIGIDRDRFSPGDQMQSRCELGLPQGVKAIAYLGRLEKEKNVTALVEAMRQIPDAELWIAGAGAEEPVLRRMAGPNVRFLGFLPPHQVPLFLRAADLLAMASHHEGLATVVLQAWATGKPVVVPPVGDFPYLMRDSGGIITPDNRTPSVAQGLRSMLQQIHTPDAAMAESYKLRRKSEAYGWERLTDQVIRIYEEAMSRRLAVVG